ncbi:MAG: D-hexose-6-phosphate mutarotase [Gammaproteobacteria bacterium]|nr:D-hexose-6-phosphate mutarotase [Gammaproteobacteria bacterium]
MNAASVEQLNKEFSFEQGSQSLVFNAGGGDIPAIEIKNEQATAIISLQGAHVLSWVPAGEDDVIWLSTEAKFAPGKSVRGGIPICWPWFGPHESNTAYPGHGFARTVLWQVTKTEALSSGETRVTFQLDTRQLDDAIKPMWPLPTIAEYRLTIGKILTIELITHNQGDQAMTIGQALHTYFKVADVSKTNIIGLKDKPYLDKTDGFKRKTQSGAVTIGEEVDRVYLQTPDDVVIDDGKRKIIIKKQGSHSTVVWNPWKEAADKMGDLGQDGYLKMLCVESANAVDDTVVVAAGESYTLLVTYELETI